MSLGQAFITAHADTTKFLPDLEKQLRTVLKDYVAKVKVAPSVTGFAAALKAELKDLPPVRVKVEGDVAALRAQLREATKTTPLTVQVKADVTALRRTLREATKDTPLTVRVSADLAALRAQLRTLTRDTPIKVVVEATNIATLRNQITRELRGVAPIQIQLVASPAAIETLRAQIQRELAAAPVVVPAITNAGTAAAAASVRSAVRPTGGNLNSNIANAALAKERAAVVALETEYAKLAELAAVAGREAARGLAGGPLTEAATKANVAVAKVGEEFAAMAAEADAASTRAAAAIDVKIAAALETVAAELLGLAQTAGVSFEEIQLAAITASAAIASATGLAAETAGTEFTAAADQIALALSSAFRGGVADAAQLATAMAAAADSIKVDFTAAAESSQASLTLLRDTAVKDAGEIALAFDAAVASITRIGKAAASSAADSVFNKLTSTASNFTKGVIGADIAIGAFGVKSAAAFQQTLVSFQSLQGELKQNAFDFLTNTDPKKGLQGFANQTPFVFKDLTLAAHTLVNGLAQDGQTVLKSLNSIGNALFLRDPTKAPANLNLVVNTLQKVASSSKLALRDLNSLQRSTGLTRENAFAAIADSLNKANPALHATAAGLQDLQAKGKLLINGKSVANTLIDAIGNIPNAAGTLDKQSKTLAGELSNAKDVIQGALRKSFGSLAGDLQTIFEPKRIQEILDPFLAKIAPQITKQFSSIADFLVKNAPAIGDAFAEVTKLGNAAIDAAQPVALKLLTIGSSILAGLNSASFKDFAATLAADLAPVFHDLEDLGSIVRDLVPLIGGLLSGAFGALKIAAEILDPPLDIIRRVLDAIASSPVGQALEFLGGQFLGAAIAGAALAKAVLAIKDALILARAASADFLATLGPIGVAIGALVIIDTLSKKFETFAVVVHGVEQVLGVVFVETLAAVVAAIFTVEVAVGSAINLILLAVGKLAGALSHVPGLGFMKGVSDAADSARNAINKATDATGSLAARLASAPKNFTFNLEVNTNQANAALFRLNGQLLSAANAISALNAAANAAQGKLIGPIIGPEKNRPIVNGGFGGTGIAVPTIPNLPTPTGAGSPSSAAKSAGNAAKSAAQTLADKIKQAKQTIIDGLTDFADTIRTGSASQIDSAFKSIEKSLRAIPNFNESGLVTFLKKENIKLDLLANERDAIQKRIDTATSKFSESFQASLSFASVTSALDDLKSAASTTTTSVTNILQTGSDGLARFSSSIQKAVQASADAANAAASTITGADLAKSLAKRLADLKAFAAEIADLQKRGLNATTLNEVISAGAGSDLAKTLDNASAATLKSVNASQKGINDIAGKIAVEAANVNDAAILAATKIGDALAGGILTGLKKREKDILAQLTILTTAIVATIKKDLGIRSPSRVAHELMTFFGKGLVNGLDAHVPHVQAAMSRINGVLANSNLPDLAGLNGTLNVKAPTSSPRMHPEDLRTLAEAWQARSAPTREIHAPITQNFTQPITPEAAAINTLRAFR